MPQSVFGQVIPVLGAGVGFPGQWSRTADSIIVSRVVLATSSNPLKFGDGAVMIPSATTGGSFQSLSDFLATASNSASLQQYFAGIAVRGVKTMQPYSALAQTGGTVVNTTATQATVGAATIVVASATGVAVGQSVEGFGLQANTLVVSVSGTTITISLPTIAALSTTNVAFTTGVVPGVGNYAQGSEADVLVRSSVTVAITAGTPQAGLPVYVRTVANANTGGTSVGDFEAANEVGTATPTIGITLGSTTLTTSTGTGIAAGQQITGPGIAPNTYIVSGATTSWVLSQPALATIASGGAASFNNTALLGTLADPFIVFRTGQIDSNNMAEVLIRNRHNA